MKILSDIITKLVLFVHFSFFFPCFLFMYPTGTSSALRQIPVPCYYYLKGLHIKNQVHLENPLPLTSYRSLLHSS